MSFRQETSLVRASAISTVNTPSSETNTSTQRSETVVLLFFEDVTSPLEEAGFVFRENLYCRPGMDPRQNPSAVVGQDYFTTEHAFRENLCAYGLEDCDRWAVDTRLNVAMWIRYCIVKSLRSRTHIPDSSIITGYKAWRLLELLGFQHHWATLGSYYFFPGVKDKDSEPGMTKFDHEKELHIHLARFGLPGTCNYERITVNERIMLETYLAEKASESTL
jgi:hypothetical protein